MIIKLRRWALKEGTTSLRLKAESNGNLKISSEGGPVD